MNETHLLFLSPVAPQRRSAQFLEEAKAVSAKLSNSAEEDNDVPDFLSRLKKKR